MIFAIIPTRFSAQNTSFSTETNAQREYVQNTVYSSSNLQSVLEGDFGTNRDNKCENYTDPNCSCILYIQSKGVNISGDAEFLQPNYWGRPFVGSVALFYYPNNDIYHASFVEEVYINGNFLVSEANYREGKYTERVIESDNKFLRGFIHRFVE